MSEDWLADVKKYVPDADEAVVAAIVRYCGIALRNRDSSLVSFSDSKETDRVRENFLRKKLALTDPDETLDSAIAAVGDRMKADRTKNRVTVYYLLAEHFGKFGLFGGAASAAGGAGGAGLAAGAAAAALSAVPAPPPPAAEPPATAPGEAATDDGGSPNASDLGAAAAGLGAAAAGAIGSAAAGASQAASGAAGAVADVAGDAASRFANLSDGEGPGTGSGMGKWLLWLLLAALIVALFFGLRSCMNHPAAVASNGADATVTGNDMTSADTNAASGAAADGNETAASAPEAGASPAAAPAGAGVVSGMRDGAPMLTVYFDTGKAAVSKGFAAAAGPLKDYVTAHPGTKLAVSGFNDPTGNAAVNAELSKNRAKAVATALAAAGIPADGVVLEKPADTTIKTADNAQARRVEVTVKP